MALIKPLPLATLPTKLDLIQDENTRLLQIMKTSAKRSFDIFWHSKDKTPQEIAAMLGPDGAKAMELHGKLQELIYATDPTWVPLVPPKAYTKNQDGTLTIGE